LAIDVINELHKPKDLKNHLQTTIVEAGLFIDKKCAEVLKERLVFEDKEVTKREDR